MRKQRRSFAQPLGGKLIACERPGISMFFRSSIVVPVAVEKCQSVAVTGKASLNAMPATKAAKAQRTTFWLCCARLASNG